jgi:hypothetical protein
MKQETKKPKAGLSVFVFAFFRRLLFFAARMCFVMRDA